MNEPVQPEQSDHEDVFQPVHAWRQAKPEQTKQEDDRHKKARPISTETVTSLILGMGAIAGQYLPQFFSTYVTKLITWGWWFTCISFMALFGVIFGIAAWKHAGAKNKLLAALGLIVSLLAFVLIIASFRPGPPKDDPSLTTTDWWTTLGN